MKRLAVVVGAVAYSLFVTLSITTSDPAQGAVLKGDTLEASQDEIARTLKSQGYTAEEFEKEDGLTEVEAEIDGVSYEIHVDPEAGKVTEIEIDD